MDELRRRIRVAAPRCAVCGGPDAEGNGCEFCPAAGADVRLTDLTNAALRDLIAHERERGRAHDELAEAARLLLALRTGEPTS